MAGLVPAIHVLLIEDLVQVLPIRVHTVDQADLPGTWPVLDVLLTLNGAEYRFVVLAPHEALEAIPSGEACDRFPLDVSQARRAMLRVTPV